MNSVDSCLLEKTQERYSMLCDFWENHLTSFLTCAWLESWETYQGSHCCEKDNVWRDQSGGWLRLLDLPSIYITCYKIVHRIITWCIWFHFWFRLGTHTSSLGHFISPKEKSPRPGNTLKRLSQYSTVLRQPIINCWVICNNIHGLREGSCSGFTSVIVDWCTNLQARHVYSLSYGAKHQETQNVARTLEVITE